MPQRQKIIEAQRYYLRQMAKLPTKSFSTFEISKVRGRKIGDKQKSCRKCQKGEEKSLEKVTNMAKKETILATKSNIKNSIGKKNNNTKIVTYYNCNKKRHHINKYTKPKKRRS